MTSRWGPWYRVTRRVKSIDYVYLQRSRREKRRVVTQAVYLGRADGGGRPVRRRQKSVDLDGNPVLPPAVARHVELLPAALVAGKTEDRQGYKDLPVAGRSWSVVGGTTTCAGETATRRIPRGTVVLELAKVLADPDDCGVARDLVRDAGALSAWLLDRGIRWVRLAAETGTLIELTRTPEEVIARAARYYTTWHELRAVVTSQACLMQRPQLADAIGELGGTLQVGGAGSETLLDVIEAIWRRARTDRVPELGIGVTASQG